MNPFRGPLRGPSTDRLGCVSLLAVTLGACSIVNAPERVNGEDEDGDGGSGNAAGSSTTQGGGAMGPGGSGGFGGVPIPVCGNGIVEADEPCDDGNRDLGDACDNDCVITEFEVEVDPTFANEWPGIGTSGVDGGKGFFVVWRFLFTNATAMDDEIRGRAYKANGERAYNTPIKLSSTPSPGQARLGTNSLGRSIVAWQDFGTSSQVRFRIVDPDGTSETADTTFFDATTNAIAVADGLISVGASGAGDFTLLWLHSFNGNPQEARVRSFDENGSNFSTVTKSLGPASGFSYPGVWGIKNGFIAARNTTGGNLGSFALDAAGTAVGGQFDLATDGSDANPNDNPFGAYLGPNDEFIAVYEAFKTVNSVTEPRILKRRFSAPGTSAELGNVVSSVHQQEFHSRVARHTNGRFIVVWAAPDYTDCDVYARVFESDGSPHADELVVNQVTDGCQSWPGVAVNSDGDAMVVWDSNPSTGGIDYRIAGIVFPRLLEKD